MASTAPSSRKRPRRTSTSSPPKGRPASWSRSVPASRPARGPVTSGSSATTPNASSWAAARSSAAGLDFELRPGDVAARGNLCTLAADGTVADRRAGRLPDDEAAAVVAKLQDGVHLDGAEVFFRHEREHRSARRAARARSRSRAHRHRPPARGRPAARFPAARARRQAHRRARHRRRRAGAARAGRRVEGERRPAARLRHATRAARVRRAVRAARRRRGDLPDVSRHRPAARHGRARAARVARRRAPDPARRAGATTTTSSCTTRGPTRPARTATARARSRPSSSSTPPCRTCVHSAPT